MKITSSSLNLPELSTCTCKGACTGYGTRSNCPPLIVLAVASLSVSAEAAAA